MSVVALKSMLDRADALVNELEKEYDNCLHGKEVSSEALILTHEVVEKCSNILDQLMTLAWTVRIKPNLQTLPKRGGYFPAARDEESFRSSMGQWQALNIDTLDTDLSRVLRSYQPMTDSKNEWISVLRDLAAKKHTGLEPQTRREDRRVTVEDAGSGSVSWGPGVTFGGGVSAMGAPIDPQTQMPVPVSAFLIYNFGTCPPWRTSKETRYFTNK